MCANYLPANKDQLAGHFHVDPREYEFKREAYPMDMAPMIRLDQSNPESGQLEVVSAMFGMVPHWAETKLARQTYNSRSETTATKPTYRSAWKHRQFCIIPVDTVFEPSYETGKPVRWGIRRVDGEPMGLAGIWEVKPNTENGVPLVSFTMLTVNADGHPLMKRFHKPEDEKRSVVVLQPDQYEAWIHTTPEEAENFLTMFPAEEFTAAPVPRPSSGKPKAVPKTKPVSAHGGLF